MAADDGHGQISNADRAVIDACAAAFDTNWTPDGIEAAAAGLPTNPEARRLGLEQLVKVDLKHRHGQRGLEEYLSIFSDLGSSSQISPKLILAEFQARLGSGQTTSVEGYFRRFPDQSAEFAKLVEEERAKSQAGSPATPIDPSLEGISPQFGRYRLIKRLGQGGMGSVYLAMDDQLDRNVALKVPTFGPGDGDEVRRRFLEEARAAASLDHPYLCPIYDFGEVNGRPYLKMAYIQGQSLAEVIGPDGMPQLQAATLIGKLALALQDAHNRGVVHRDLKPSNVMLKQSGSRREPVIVDFGLARRLDAGGERMTQAGQILGTLWYMAPEQLRGEIDLIGPRSDIYALGVIFYEILTGKLPHKADGWAVVTKILTSPPTPPSQYRPDLDPKLEAICLKAMARDAGDRYQKMSELAAAVTGWIQAHSSLSSSGSNAKLGSAAAVVPPQTAATPQPVAVADQSNPKPSTEHKVPQSQDKPDPEPAIEPAPVPPSSSGRKKAFVAAGVMGCAVVIGGLAMTMSGGKNQGTKTTHHRKTESESGSAKSEIGGEKVESNLSEPVDLVALFRPDELGRMGSWRREGTTLISSMAAQDMTIIPYSCGDRYVIKAKVKYMRGKPDFQIWLPRGDTKFLAVIDGWGGEVSGFSYIDGKPAELNPTRHEGRIIKYNADPVELEVWVRPREITLRANGRIISRYDGPDTHLSIPKKSYLRNGAAPTKAARGTTNSQQPYFTKEERARFPLLCTHEGAVYKVLSLTYQNILD